MLGGDNDTSGLSSAELYSSITLTWHALPKMTHGRATTPVACIVNETKVLVCGGSGSDGGGIRLATCEMLDIVNGSAGWRTMPSMLNSLTAAGGTILANNGLFIVTGGFSDLSHVALNACEKYDWRQAKWSRIASMACTRAHHGSVLFQDKVIVLGGHNGSHELSSCEQYYPSNNMWVSFPSLLSTRYSFGAAVVFNKIYVAGGMRSQNGGIMVSSVEVFDGDEWTMIQYTLVSPRWGCVSVMFGDMWVTLGGLAKDNQNYIEAYDFEASLPSYIPEMIEAHRTRPVAVAGSHIMQQQGTMTTDECASGPCLNGGTCTDSINTYICVCKNGYQGLRCGTIIPPRAGFIRFCRTKVKYMIRRSVLQSCLKCFYFAQMTNVVQRAMVSEILFTIEYIMLWLVI